MPDDSLYRQVALASAKWYMPLNPQLLKSCDLRPLPREADSSDEVQVEFKPTIAFPAALSPQTIEGKDPLDMKGLFFSPLIVRLHYVAQLSTTYLRANIDAKHCRLSHALGTLCILSSFVEILVTRMRNDEETYAHCKPNQDEIVAAFTYAALHDAFQGPFGHALDAIREELVGGLPANRRLDKTLLNFIIGGALNFKENSVKQGFPSPPIAIKVLCDVLEQTVARPYGIDLIRLLRWIHDASLADISSLDEGSVKRRRELGWLYELLEGPLDADRWDYLWRDTLHLGFTRDNGELWDLLQEFWRDITVHWDGVRSRLTISESLSKRMGGDFFFLRKSLYKNVYENPEKRVIDSILVRCIYSGVLARIPRSENWATHDQRYLEFLINLVHVTDSDLLAILEQVDNPILGYLARELGTYPAVRVFWQEVMREVEIDSALKFHSDKLEAFRYTGTSPPMWAMLPLEDGEDASPREEIRHTLEETYSKLRIRVRAQVTNVISIGEAYLPSLLLHCSIMPKRPARVLQFERVIWRIVVRHLRQMGIIEKICLSVRKILAETYAIRFEISNQQILELLDGCPPFFVSFPWIPNFSAEAMQEMSREPSGSRIAIRRPGGRTIYEKSPAELMPRTADSETYIAVAGYSLHATNELNEHEREVLESTAKWAIRKLLEYGCCLALPKDLIRPEYDIHIVNYLRDQVGEGML
jgi:HD superfamily phosphohydrolase